jgi:hypothetical protein
MFFEVQNNLIGRGSWYWMLKDGTPENPGEPIAVQGHINFDTETECRAHVAVFRKKASGVKFAKVVTR